MNIYNDIKTRTKGEIYIGVVGPVRSGKSTFIKKFMDTIVIPNIEDIAGRERAIDELPQSASGRTIMTTEPKFIPEQAVTITVEEAVSFAVRLIDCVGYIVPSSIGYIEENQPRMVKTPWFDEDIPFNMAAEIGTKKVITEHSTIGLLVTTDGSISDIPREEYEEAEERVVLELNETGKPYVILLNCTEPASENSKILTKKLNEKYDVPVMPVNCNDINQEDILKVLNSILMEFPVTEVSFNLPNWLLNLENDHWLKNSIVNEITNNYKISRVREVRKMLKEISNSEHINSLSLKELQLGTGKAETEVNLEQKLFYKILGEKSGLDFEDDSALYTHLMEMSAIKERFIKLQSAYDDVLTTGYGIVMPDIEELSLEEPKIIKQNGKYGIKLRATAPSIHIECIKQKYRICKRWTKNSLHNKIQYRSILNSIKIIKK